LAGLHWDRAQQEFDNRTNEYVVAIAGDHVNGIGYVHVLAVQAEV
jgi:hypothetical protein